MRKQKYLVTQHLENISGEVLQDYSGVIKEFIRGKAGVYALYKKQKFYYVGLASNLMSRLKIHLNDRHKGLWDRFSVYLTVHDEHMKELESLLLRIYKPEGNRAGGSFTQSKNLKSNLNKKIKEIDDSKRAALVGIESKILKRTKKHSSQKGSKEFEWHLSKRLALKAKHKKKEYTATLRKDGTISFKSKIYNAPSTAATAVTGTSIDGWHFWKYKNEKGEWVKLNELRK